MRVSPKDVNRMLTIIESRSRHMAVECNGETVYIVMKHDFDVLINYAKIAASLYENEEASAGDNL